MKLTGAGRTLPPVPKMNPHEKARWDCHRLFDVLWNRRDIWKGNGPKERRIAGYNWLQRTLRLSKEDAHFSRMSEEQCKAALHHMQELIQ